ncbi:MAG: 30S ribosome-binding factor RbfA [Oceanospirillaceae bacterium]|jgi:ribosome-binding factor A|nr:30S ribosome-binding factor RbfA [Oceanospirillaceae bacterium]MBT4443979.1 30S ribosome-binding factor RbfA [Oceanospirillaceae bacterium]MBT6076675.1 30S ribosome-binding factor RbfA [Oceanospirillaceae bacterium]MBT7330614.1 30S ribosome-binding factor RbfA [Oceanospirillaceae bacterium]
MAQEYSRTQRVADQIQRELAALIQREVKDPRVGMATVSAVEVSRDLSHAKVFVTIFNGGENQEEIRESVKVLNNASGFLRSKLGQRMKLRIVPTLRFHFDDSLSRGNYLSNLIDEARASDSELESDVDYGTE